MCDCLNRRKYLAGPAADNFERSKENNARERFRRASAVEDRVYNSIRMGGWMDG